MNSPPAQILQIPLRVGLDESTDPGQVPPGTLERLRNGVWKKIGRVEKRDGTTHLSSTVIAGGAAAVTMQRLLDRSGELLATDGVALYSRLAAQWKRVQEMPSLEATWSTLVDTMSSVSAADIDANSSYRASAWVVQVGATWTLFVQVEDAVTGARVLPPTQVVTTIKLFRVLVFDDTLLVLYQGSSNNIVTARRWTLSTLTDHGSTALRTDVSSAADVTWDVCHNGSDWTLFYKDNTTNVLKLYTYTSALGAVANANVVTAANARVLSLCATTGEKLYAAYTENTSFLVNVAVHNPSTLAQTTAATVIYNGAAVSTRISVVRRDATSCIVAFTEAPTLSSNEHTITFAVSSTAAVFTESHRITRWASLASKLFALGGRFYVLLSSIRPAISAANARITQNTTFLVEVHTSDGTPLTGSIPHKPAAFIAPREAAIPSHVWAVSSSPVVGTEAFTTAHYVTEQVSASNVARRGLRLIRLSTALSDPWAPATIGRALVMAGALNGTFDGRRLFELGFLHAPRAISATPGSGGNMAAGTYQYAFVYEWRDATGLLHRSIPSQPQSVTVGAGGLVDFVLECACTTGKSDLVTGNTSSNALSVAIVPYRTTVGGSTFYRMALSPSFNTITNDAMTASVNWQDDKADNAIDLASTQLNTRPLLYTTGGILDEVLPPSFTTHRLHRGRLWGVAGDRKTIWYSKKFTEDPGVFPGFHENLRVVVDDDIVGIESLDDKLVIFTEGAIYALYGDGPTANGLSSDLEGPILITGDISCSSARSLVAFPGGILFRAAAGFYLLTRGLELVWLGRAVKDDAETNPKTLFAEIVPHKNQVRIGVSDVAESAGLVLVFDYENKLWSIFTYPSSVVRSLAVVGGVVYQTSGAEVAKEDASTNLDNGTWVELDLEVPLSPSGPVGWQHVRRVQLLGERRTHHNLRLRIAFDYRSTYSQDFTFTAEQVVTNNDSPTVRVGSQNGANPKCKAIRVRVTDATPSDPGGYPVTTGKGGWFSAIALELIPKPGLPRHGARHSKV